MNVGIYFTANQEKGGVFQFSLTLLNQLAKTKLKDNFTLFSSSLLFSQEKRQLKKRKNWRVVELAPTQPDTARSTVKFHRIRRLLGGFYDRHLKPFIGYEPSRAESFLNQYNLDLLLYPVIDSSCYRQKAPFIVWVHDLQHRLNPQFPEVSQKGERQKREQLYQKALKKALLVVAESQTGKKQIQKFYPVGEKKIAVLPYLPPAYLATPSPQLLKRVQNKYHLPKTFIFYPANFWPHKNHRIIIEALAQLKQKGLLIWAVFVGQPQPQWSEYDRVMELAQKLKVARQVKHLGYVNNQEMAALYRSALALVMPTFFGPSNIPPLEAFKLGCPVISSDIEGVREQVGQAAILVNPEDSQELAEAIGKLYRKPQLRRRLIQKGKQRIASWTQKDFRNKLKTIITKAKRKIDLLRNNNDLKT